MTTIGQPEMARDAALGPILPRRRKQISEEALEQRAAAEELAAVAAVQKHESLRLWLQLAAIRRRNGIADAIRGTKK